VKNTYSPFPPFLYTSTLILLISVFLVACEDTTLWQDTVDLKDRVLGKWVVTGYSILPDTPVVRDSLPAVGTPIIFQFNNCDILADSRCPGYYQIGDEEPRSFLYNTAPEGDDGLLCFTPDDRYDNPLETDGCFEITELNDSTIRIQSEIILIREEFPNLEKLQLVKWDE
jgi:hypothetical protein